MGGGNAAPGDEQIDRGAREHDTVGDVIAVGGVSLCPVQFLAQRVVDIDGEAAHRHCILKFCAGENIAFGERVLSVNVAGFPDADGCAGLDETGGLESINVPDEEGQNLVCLGTSFDFSLRQVSHTGSLTFDHTAHIDDSFPFPDPLEEQNTVAGKGQFTPFMSSCNRIKIAGHRDVGDLIGVFTQDKLIRTILHGFAYL